MQSLERKQNMNKETIIELVYNADCWQISEIRKALRLALLKSGYKVFWKEWKSDDEALPERLKHESPFALFINEKLTLQVQAGEVPSESELMQLISQKQNSITQKKEGKRKFPKIKFSILSVVGVAIIPKCPLCWAAYMSIFSALGFSAIPYPKWLLPAMVIFLIASVGFTLYQAFIRKRFTYMRWIFSGLVLLLLGKFILNITLIMYLGVAVLIATSFGYQLSRRPLWLPFGKTTS